MKRWTRSKPLCTRVVTISIAACLALASACGQPESGPPRDDRRAPELAQHPPASAARGDAPAANSVSAAKAAGATETAGAVAPAGECGADHAGCGCAGHVDEAEDEAPVEAIDLRTAPVWGRPTAPVTIVMFADLECPYSKRAWQTIRRLETEYEGKLRVAFKHRPLPMHANARLAARAAIAAHAQGKFWDYEEALFASEGPLEAPYLEQSATALGLDLARFRRTMDTSSTEALIAADDAEADRLKVLGTPTFFVNGRRIKGAQPIEVFRGAIDRALAGR